MKINRGIIIGLVLILQMLLISCGYSEKEEQDGKPETVNIGIQTLVTPELIARYEKVYEEYLGTNVNLIIFDSGADVNKAFTSGSIDIGAVGTSPVAIGISKDLGYEVIWYHDIIGSAETLIAKKDSGISSVEDLIGKTVATPFASTAHFSLLNAMKLAGVDPSEVELLDMQPDDIYAAWSRGDIDAAYVWDPVLSYLKEDGGVSIIDSEELSKQGIITADLCVVRKDFAEQYPEVVVGYIEAQMYALDKFNDDTESAIGEISEALDVSYDSAVTQVAGFIYPGANEQISSTYLGTKDNVGDMAEILKQTADFLVEQGSIDEAPELAEFESCVSGEFIEEALQKNR